MPIIISGTGTGTGDFEDLLTELYARGFSYLNDDTAGRTRAERWVNSAYFELDRMFLWPWRETTVSGAVPLAITDLGPIASVTDAANCPLQKVNRQEIVEGYGDLTLTGSPWCYYTDWSSGTKSVTTYPVATAAITVRYWRVPAAMTSAGDLPDVPEEARYLIVDLAVRRAYQDSDNPQSAEAIQTEIDRQIDGLLFQYQPGMADGPDAYQSLGFSATDW